MTVEPPLSRRIEELARYDEPEPDAAGLSGTVSALRGDLSAVRAELGSLRSELGAVRTDLDSLGGRLTGSVAASRTETGTLVRRVAEMAGRFDALGGRLDEVRADMPGIAREVREGLELLPVRTGTQLDDVVGRVTDKVGLRVDQMAADVRRTVTSALESDARSAAGTQAALVDARGALESRMAVLEDGLENVAERLEAFARDGAHTTKELLGELLGHVRRLDERVEQLGGEQVESVVTRLTEVTEGRTGALAERLEAVLEERTTALREEVRTALGRTGEQTDALRGQVDALGESTRSTLDGVSGSVQDGLAALRDSVAGALREDREAARTDLGAMQESVTGTVGALQEDQRRRARQEAERSEAALQALDTRIEGLRAQVVSAVNDLRTDVATEIGVLRPQVEELSEATSAATTASTVLRGELTTEIGSLRERLATTTAASTEAVRAALVETRSEVADGQRALREALLDRLQEQHSQVTDRLTGLANEVTGDAGATREAGERLA
ncbi:MAG: hypothetical protein JWN17_1428, partial [Frankiales bacterium]|nr:hypothetical protein [Frankiales bacterium]